MIFSPPKATGLTFGLAALFGLGGLGGLSLIFIRAAAPSLLTFTAFVLLIAIGLALVALAYGVFGLVRARYILSRNALVVEWGWRREVIPMEALGEVEAGAAIDPARKLRPRGLVWPGCVTGFAPWGEGDDVEVLAATDSLAGLVLIEYPGGGLALSPADPAAFVQTLNALRAEGVEDVIEPESRRAGLADWPIWRDRPAAALILLCGLSVVALVGYITLIYPQLPPQLALHFDAQGQPNRFGPPAGLFLLPTIAGLVWFVNTLGGLWLHRRVAERTGAYLLFGATAFAQGLLWVATIGLLTAGR
jgi:hypothetical protein